MLEELFEEALARLVSDDRQLLEIDASERTLCARLAMKLENGIRERELEGYYADADYNRKQGGQVKTIVDGNYEVIAIVADVVVHSRGRIVARDNLLAIEMKKATRPPIEKERDRQRLIAMTKPTYDEIWVPDGVTQPDHVCGYELGVFVDIDLVTMRASLEFFKGGVSTDRSERNI